MTPLWVPATACTFTTVREGCNAAPPDTTCRQNNNDDADMRLLRTNEGAYQCRSRVLTFPSQVFGVFGLKPGFLMLKLWSKECALFVGDNGTLFFLAGDPNGLTFLELERARVGDIAGVDVRDGLRELLEVFVISFCSTSTSPFQ